MLRSPEIAQRLQSLSLEAGATSPAETAKFFADETALWGKVIKEAGLEPQYESPRCAPSNPQTVLAAIVALLAPLGAMTAQETRFPTRAVTVVVVPFPPGGWADALPRIVAEKLRERWGVSR